MEEFLRLVEEDRVQVEPLITHRVPFAESDRAYDLLTGKTSENYLGIVLTYPERASEARPETRIEMGKNGAPAPAVPARRRQEGEPLGVGLLGAGNVGTS